MRTWNPAVLLIAAGMVLQPVAPAQSVWRKMKQSMQQAERNAQAQSRQAHQTQQTSAHTSSASAGHAQPVAANRGASVSAPPAAVDISSPVIKALYRKLEVGGVALGMSSREAQTALQSRNRCLAKGQVQPFVFSDLPNTEFTSRAVYTATQPQYEIVSLGLTLQPMQPEVLSIGRETRYEIDHQPTGDNTIAALRAKYGSETTREDIPLMDSTNLRWVFDGEGHVLSKSQAQRFLNACPQSFQEPSSGYIGGGLRKGWDVNCEPYTFLKANLS